MSSALGNKRASTKRGGNVYLNGQRVMFQGGQLAANSVRSIVVNGSDHANNIDLSAVRAETFRNFSGGSTINGGSGTDTIRGTQFNDVINGGADGDRIFGGYGRDTIRGEGGDDNISGDGSSDSLGDADSIDGGMGSDTIYGGGGDDLIVGGGGRDTVWIDAADYRYAHGWDWAGIELTRTGNPPRI